MFLFWGIRRVAALSAWSVLTLLGLVLTSGCSDRPAANESSEAPTLTATSVPWHALPGRASANFAPPAQAFQRSCSTWDDADPAQPMHPERAWFGTMGDWQHACRRLAERPDSVSRAHRFRQLFQPVRLSTSDTTALLTGYYEPILQGAPAPSSRYNVPLRRVPDDLLRIDLGEFRDRFEDETLIGRQDGNRVVPYYDREAIRNGALDDQNLAFLWVDSRIDKFFLQIQGSGRIQLPDGTMTRVGYAGQNGRPYRAIGRDLVEMGEVPRSEMSMQRIRQWMADHPDRANDLMNRNASYIFFQERTDLDPEAGPIGSQGVPLTAEHSLAVDPKVIPMGMPVWISGTAPTATDDSSTVLFQRLMVAQDTGGAIRGPLRGDVFWGHGENAETRAGRMQHPATWYVLVPRAALRDIPE
ncbi:MAG: MltA domain-containing protein [Longimonas sp.]